MFPHARRITEGISRSLLRGLFPAHPKRNIGQSHKGQTKGKVNDVELLRKKEAHPDAQHHPEKHQPRINLSTRHSGLPSASTKSSSPLRQLITAIAIMKSEYTLEEQNRPLADLGDL